MKELVMQTSSPMFPTLLLFQIIARTFPLVNDMVQEAMGETLYHIFMSDPDSLYLNIDTVQADILVSNKVDIPKSK